MNIIDLSKLREILKLIPKNLADSKGNVKPIPSYPTQISTRYDFNSIEEIANISDFFDTIKEPESNSSITIRDSILVMEAFPLDRIKIVSKKLFSIPSKIIYEYELNKTISTQFINFELVPEFNVDLPFNFYEYSKIKIGISDDKINIYKWLNNEYIIAASESFALQDLVPPEVDVDSNNLPLDKTNHLLLDLQITPESIQLYGNLLSSNNKIKIAELKTQLLDTSFQYKLSVEVISEEFDAIAFINLDSIMVVEGLQPSLLSSDSSNSVILDNSNLETINTDISTKLDSLQTINTTASNLLTTLDNFKKDFNDDLLNVISKIINNTSNIVNVASKLIDIKGSWNSFISAIGTKADSTANASASTQNYSLVSLFRGVFFNLFELKNQLGSSDDIPATDTTGSFSLISLFKKAVGDIESIATNILSKSNSWNALAIDSNHSTYSIVNNEVTINVPANKQWQLVNFYIDYTSDAVDGIRILNVKVYKFDSTQSLNRGKLYYNFSSFIPQVLSTTYNYTFGVSLPTISNIVNETNIICSLSPAVLPSQFIIVITDNNAVSSNDTIDVKALVMESNL
jgi:hypothetical protein